MPIALKDFRPRQEGESDREWSDRVWQCVVDNWAVLGSIVNRYGKPRDASENADLMQLAAVHAHRILSNSKFNPTKGAASTWLCNGLCQSMRAMRMHVKGGRMEWSKSANGKWKATFKHPPVQHKLADGWAGMRGELLDVHIHDHRRDPIPSPVQAVRDAIAAVPMDEVRRAILIGVLVEGRTKRAMVEPLGICDMTVAKWLAQATAALRVWLAGDHPAAVRLREVADAWEAR